MSARTTSGSLVGYRLAAVVFIFGGWTLLSWAFHSPRLELVPAPWRVAERLVELARTELVGDILRNGVVGITEIIVRPGLINVDFADVRSIMGNAGTALMGMGEGVGKTRAVDAAAAAVLLEAALESERRTGSVPGELVTP